MKRFKFKKRLEGHKVNLKAHTQDIADTMFRYVEKDRQRLDKFLPWVAHTKTIEDQRNFIRHTQKSWEEMTLFGYGIYLKETNAYIGNIGVHVHNWAHYGCEVGYWIQEDFEGKGHITDAVKTLEKYIFEEGFHRIEICCSRLNEKSANVPRRNGYHFDGTLRGNLPEKGQFRDTLVFSKLSKDDIESQGTPLIRRARHLDAKEIIKTHIRSIREICSKDYGPKQIKAWSGRDFKESIWCDTIDKDHVWVLDNGSSILGFGHLEIKNKIEAEIQGLYFSPDIIGQGKGKELIQKMKSYALEKGVKKIILFSTLTAKTFYEKQGFLSSSSPIEVLIGGVKIGCVPMEIRLSQ